MLKNLGVFFVCAGLAGLSLNTAFAGEGKWTCQKDDKVVKVTGKTKKEKKSDCESQGGTWEKAKSADSSADSSAKGSSQKSGGGGGW